MDLIRSERHVKAARARWGDPRSVRLDSLEPPVRAAVRALIEANEAAKKAPDPLKSDALEVSRVAARPTPTRAV